MTAMCTCGGLASRSTFASRSRRHGRHTISSSGRFFAFGNASTRDSIVGPGKPRSHRPSTAPAAELRRSPQRPDRRARFIPLIHDVVLRSRAASLPHIALLHRASESRQLTWPHLFPRSQTPDPNPEFRAGCVQAAHSRTLPIAGYFVESGTGCGARQTEARNGDAVGEACDWSRRRSIR